MKMLQIVLYDNKNRGHIINRMTYPLSLLKNGGYLLSHYTQYHRRGEA